MRLELQITLSLLRKGSAHSLGADPSQVADLHLPAGRGPHPVAVVLHGVELIETPGLHRDPVDPSSASWAAAVGWLDRAFPR